MLAQPQLYYPSSPTMPFMHDASRRHALAEFDLWPTCRRLSPAPPPEPRLPAHLKDLTESARGYVEASNFANTSRAYAIPVFIGFTYGVMPILLVFAVVANFLQRIFQK